MVSFMSSKYELYSLSDIVMLYVIWLYIAPCYNSTRPYISSNTAYPENSVHGLFIVVFIRGLIPSIVTFQVQS